MWYVAGVEESVGANGREDIAEALEQAAILMTRHLTARAALSPTAALALGRLNEEGPVRLTALATAAGISQPSMTDAAFDVCLAGVPSRSMRASMAACTVAGTLSSATSARQT
jgi:hypothetical protein